MKEEPKNHDLESRGPDDQGNSSDAAITAVLAVGLLVVAFGALLILTRRMERVSGVAAALSLIIVLAGWRMRLGEGLRWILVITAVLDFLLLVGVAGIVMGFI